MKNLKKQWNEMTVKEIKAVVRVMDMNTLHSICLSKGLPIVLKTEAKKQLARYGIV